MRAKFNRDYIASIDNVLTGDVTLTERESQLILMALTNPSFRYNWDDMTDTQWDTMQQLVDRVSFRLMDITYV